jgi:hypothetical protein
MVTVAKLELAITRPDPLVWVSRLVLFATTNPVQIIRDVPLRRGLNIVWATDKDTDSSDETMMAGHGVGKTTFCRLLRYCLGESTFAKAALIKRIREEFPQGMVGAQVHVKGQLWAVARPVGNTHVSYAKPDSTIEALLDERPARQSYQAFLDALQSAALGEYPGDLASAGGDLVTWNHILAWCTRDQEARFQNLWEWRSARSESATPAFRRPKADAMVLLRTALGLLVGEEVQVQKRLADIDRERSVLETNIAQRRQEPQYWSRRLRRQLTVQYGIEGAETAEFDQADMFSIPPMIDARKATIAQRQTILNDKTADLDRRIPIVAAQVNEAEQFANARVAATQTTEGATDALDEGIRLLEAEKGKVEAASDGLCMYGAVKIGDCRYVQDNLAQLDSRLRLQATQTVSQVAQRDQVTAAMREAASRATETARRLRNQLGELTRTRRESVDELATLRQDSRAIDTIHADLARWESILSARSEDAELADLQSQHQRLEQEKGQVEQRRQNLLSGHADQLGALSRVFCGLVASVLSDEFQGSVQLGSEADVQFSIAHGTVMAGEAVETLAILLADLACQLLGAEGRCRHPGFVIHDSPREADLGLRIYRRFLSYLANLHASLGGPDTAPYQYIVTTTTPPPADLRIAKYLRLQLNGDEEDGLLFKKNLGKALPAEAADLFSAEKDG